MRKLLLLLFSFTLQVLPAQNLVPNGSFEEYGACPELSDQLVGNVSGWYKCPGTPDYFNECAEGTSYGVPTNIFDYQWAAQGTAYSGVVTYAVGVPHAREIIYAELESPLAIGVPTCLSMKVAPGGHGNYPVAVGWTSRGIGLRLSLQPFEWAPETPFPNDAQLYADEVLTDTSGWTTLSAVYVPDSAYQYVAIGNFFADSLIAVVAIDSNGFDFAYAFVDEVCVSQALNGCDLSTSLEQRGHRAKCWAITPFSEQLIVQFQSPNQQSVQVDLFDEQGRLCSTAMVGVGQETLVWNVAPLKDGLYIIAAQSRNMAYTPIRVVKMS